VFCYVALSTAKTCFMLAYHLK